MRPKSEIYSPKRDDEHPHPFHLRSPPPRLPGLFVLWHSSIRSLYFIQICIVIPLTRTSPHSYLRSGPILAFSYILSNGYRYFRFALPAGMFFKSETKIEPDLSLPHYYSFHTFYYTSIYIWIYSPTRSIFYPWWCRWSAKKKRILTFTF